MDLRQLEMLLAVADAGSYSKAGERLHISHSAVHRQIRLLEYEMGDRILVRSDGRIELTGTGSLIANLARRVFEDIAQTERHIAERNQLQSGHLRIGTGSTMLAFFLQPALDGFCKHRPGIDVQVVTGTAGYVLREVQNGSLDLGIMLIPAETAPEFAGVHCHVLYTEEFVLAVGKDHPLLQGRDVTLAQVAEFPLITHCPTSHVRRLIEQRFVDAGVTPKIAMELENEEAMEEMIQLNRGVAPLSKSRALRNNVQFLSCAGSPILCDVGLVSPNREYVPPIIREFTGFCRSFSKISSSIPVSSHNGATNPSQ